jgi:hypothetical protein
MTVIKREDVPRPVRKKETVACADLGGDVIVQQLTLQQYLETTRISAQHHNTAQIACLLADCIVDADGTPIFSEDEWNAWAPAHLEAVFALFQKVRALSGLDLEAAAKN